jgi:hypothetical protein
MSKKKKKKKEKGIIVSIVKTNRDIQTPTWPDFSRVGFGYDPQIKFHTYIHAQQVGRPSGTQPHRKKSPSLFITMILIMEF